MHNARIIPALLILILSPHTYAQDFNHYFNTGNSYFHKKEFDNALEQYTLALTEKSEYPEPYINIGLCYFYKKKYTTAITFFKRALLISPSHAKARFHYAQNLEKEQNLDEALAQYEQIITENPNYHQAYYHAGILYRDKKQIKKALEYLQKAVELKPNDLNALLHLGNTYNMINRLEHAFKIYRKMDEIHSSAASQYNLAFTLKRMNRLDEALPRYQKLVKEYPNYIDAHFGLGLLYLLGGDFTNGFNKYEWRLKKDASKQFKTFSMQPLWDGTSLSNKTILLHAEQGLGDTFQFIRYAQRAKDAGGTVIVAVQKPLKTILSHCPYIDTVIAYNDPLPNHDVQAPLMSLPYILGDTISTIPANIPYLCADETLTELWKKKLSSDTNVKIGICWQGNNKYPTESLRTIVASKSTPLTSFSKLATIPNITFYSLQRETGIDQATQLRQPFPLIAFDNDFDKTNGRFMDTAALIKNLDLVITIDTSIAHFAAGIGTPTWVLIPNPPDWRWMLDRTDTPWYPNMRLFRQTTIDNWDSVFTDIYQALLTHISLL